MSDQIKNRYDPNYGVPPGETLLESIEKLGMSQAELAQRMGRPLKTINEIIKGKAAITADTALQLEKVLRIPASFWNNAECTYREALARREEQKRLERQSAWLREIPLKSLTQFAWIKAWNEPAKQVEELLRFFGVASTAAWRNVWVQGVAGRIAVEFRKSPAFQSDWAALASWLRKGELEAQGIQCADFSADRFKSALTEIRKLTVQRPDTFQESLLRLCAESGVAVTFVPCLPKTHVSGATQWLSSTKAIIQLSLRGKSNDILWFNFFHEAGHILLHGKKQVFIEDGEKDSKEREADAFASNILIPPIDLQRFRSQGKLTKAGIQRFAQEVGIAPGIVVGRLQHDGDLPRSHFNDLKQWLTWADVEETDLKE
jgi:HTH-type transcriptional regulator/antitoxin HigA